jgi:hypothetical protein
VKGTGSNKITFKKAADFWAANLFFVEGGKLSFENITLSRSAGNFDTWCIACVTGGTLEIKKGAVLSFNDGGNNYYIGVMIDVGNFIMSGGTIEKCQNGVFINENSSGKTITMSGGTIRDNTECAIAQWGAKNSTVNISGGTIEKCQNGIALNENASGNSITMSGGTIKENTGSAICLWGAANSTVTISGGTISKNGDLGVYFRGANSKFEKAKGSVIYGKTGDNKNNNGAILIHCGNEANNLKLDGDAGKNGVFKATTNADGSGIASQEGTWNL